MSNKNTVKEPEQDGLLFGRHGRDAQQRSERNRHYHQGSREGIIDIRKNCSEVSRRSQSSMAKNILDEVKKGSEVLVEITPYFSTWDYTKSKF